MDFNSQPNDLSLHKVTRVREDSDEVKVEKSTAGKITIFNYEIYPENYVHEGVSRTDLPHIEIDLNSKVFDKVNT